jgi:hypothetical protein
MASGSSPRTETPPDLAVLEARLQAVLEPYRERLIPIEVYGQPFLAGAHANKHQWFAGVNLGNSVVRFSLLPVHAHPELLEGLSPGLRRRKTGASLFTFKEIDDGELTELADLVRRAFEAYQGDGRTG